MRKRRTATLTTSPVTYGVPLPQGADSTNVGLWRVKRHATKRVTKSVQQRMAQIGKRRKTRGSENCPKCGWSWGNSQTNVSSAICGTEKHEPERRTNDNCQEKEAKGKRERVRCRKNCQSGLGSVLVDCIERWCRCSNSAMCLSCGSFLCW